MEIQRDFRDLLELLNSKGVDYLIVGGYALAYHGCPRFTGDIDIYVRANSENAAKVLEALKAFGFGGVGIGLDDLCTPEKVIQLGVPPVRIDLITSISGVSEDKAFSDAAIGEYGDLTVRFLSRKCLVANKRASGRAKDLADLESLGEQDRQ